MIYNISSILEKLNTKIPKNRAFRRNKHVKRAERAIIKYQHEYELADSRIKKDFLAFLETKTDAYRLVLKALLLLTNFGEKLSWHSQKAIAKEAGVSISSVGRIIKEFISDGLLIKAKQKYKTDVLRLSNLFREKWMKKRLRIFFGLILFMPMSLLFSFSKKRCLSEYERLLKEEKSFFLHDVDVFKKKKRKRQKFEAKKRKSCSMSISNEHMQLISEVKFITLTKRGITELVKFSPMAIKFALGQVPYMSSYIKDKFTWFCKQCWDYTKANGEQLNNTLYEKCKFAAIRNNAWTEKTHDDVSNAHVMHRGGGHKGQGKKNDYGPTFAQGETYWKYGKEYGYPDQAVDEFTNPCRKNENYKERMAQDDPRRYELDPQEELRNAMEDPRMNKEGLKFLQGVMKNKKLIPSVLKEEITEELEEEEMIRFSVVRNVINKYVEGKKAAPELDQFFDKLEAQQENKYPEVEAISTVDNLSTVENPVRDDMSQTYAEEDIMSEYEDTGYDNTLDPFGDRCIQ